MAGYDPKKANPTAIIPEAPGKITRKKKKPKEIAVVIPDNCTGCEACVSFCPVDCIEHTPRDTSDGINVVIPNVQIRFDECIGCKICVNVCERMAWDSIKGNTCWARTSRVAPFCIIFTWFVVISITLELKNGVISPFLNLFSMSGRTQYFTFCPISEPR